MGGFFLLTQLLLRGVLIGGFAFVASLVRYKLASDSAWSFAIAFAALFHRVHHGVDAACIDKNFGGVPLVFDRIFATFAPYEREPTFGVAGDSPHMRPLSANVAPLRDLFDCVRREPTIRGKLRVMLRPRR